MRRLGQLLRRITGREDGTLVRHASSGRLAVVVRFGKRGALIRFLDAPGCREWVLRSDLLREEEV